MVIRPTNRHGWMSLTRTLLDGAYHAAAQPHDRANPYSTVRNAVTATILAQATLESYVNEQIEMGLIARKPVPYSETQWEAVAELLQKTTLLDKWRLFAQVGHAATFDEGREPFQGFVVLVRLRNFLAHYSPKPTEGDLHDPPDKKLLAGLEARYTFSTQPGWMERMLNVACARWACEVARAMIKEHARITGMHDLFTPYTSPGSAEADPPMYPPPPWEGA